MQPSYAGWGSRSRSSSSLAPLAPVSDSSSVSRPGGGRLFALFEREALLVEVVAEVLGEPGDELVQLRLGFVAPVAVGDLLEQLGLVASDRVGQVGQELGTLSTLIRST